MIGTLGAGTLEQLMPLANTTPDAVTVQRYLAEFVASGITHVAIEASSIALDQGRLDGCRITSAVFTNLSRDHLDYHADMAAYGQAKARLFAWPGLTCAVVNQADPVAALCLAGVADHVAIYRCGIAGEELRAELLPHDQLGLKALVFYQGECLGLTSSLLGVFNLDNLLTVAAILLDQGLSFSELAPVLSQIKSVPGRLQVLPGLPAVVVDYAHTPAALEQVLATLRPYVKGQLWCVFGCGGNRDRGKRPLMGAIAGTWADHSLLTNDNPRLEDPHAILIAIAKGMPIEASYEIIEDRALAIAQAINAASANDIILIAGKGHETYQEIGIKKEPFNDVSIAMACLVKNSII